MATENYLIAYDIVDKKRLAKVRKVAYSYALGGQKSAVEAPLDPKMLRKLTERLSKLIHDKDKVNIIMIEGEPLCFGKADFIRYEDGVILL